MADAQYAPARLTPRTVGCSSAGNVNGCPAAERNSSVGVFLGVTARRAVGSLLVQTMVAVPPMAREPASPRPAASMPTAPPGGASNASRSVIWILRHPGMSAPGNAQAASRCFNQRQENQDRATSRPVFHWTLLM